METGYTTISSVSSFFAILIVGAWYFPDGLHCIHIGRVLCVDDNVHSCRSVRSALCLLNSLILAAVEILLDFPYRLQPCNSCCIFSNISSDFFVRAFLCRDDCNQVLTRSAIIWFLTFTSCQLLTINLLFSGHISIPYARAVFVNQVIASWGIAIAR